MQNEIRYIKLSSVWHIIVFSELFKKKMERTMHALTKS